MDVRSCRLAGIVEANTEAIPVFSPLDEFCAPTLGEVADYSWVDVENVRSPLRSYIYDGARWYSAAEVKFLLAYGVCTWQHILLVFNATSHRHAVELASKLKKIRLVWQEVSSSIQAQIWAGSKAKKDINIRRQR